MDQHLQDGGEPNKISLINHVFSTTDESKAELFNAVQYGLIGVVPVVLLNKIIQKFIPDADPEKSSLELEKSRGIATPSFDGFHSSSKSM